VQNLGSAGHLQACITQYLHWHPEVICGSPDPDPEIFFIFSPAGNWEQIFREFGSPERSRRSYLSTMGVWDPLNTLVLHSHRKNTFDLYFFLQMP
jgi:hypothetical protein